ncbi:MAG TPA: hypothetical protein VFQ06_14925 [Nitrospira sp.]|nr:hypothetical protein [Nitrospira sp.]
MSMKGIWGDTLRRLVDLQEAVDKTITVLPCLRRPASRKTGTEWGTPPRSISMRLLIDMASLLFLR